jgi:hypothetical protein
MPSWTCNGNNYCVRTQGIEQNSVLDPAQNMGGYPNKAAVVRSWPSSNRANRGIDYGLRAFHLGSTGPETESDQSCA